MGGSSRYQKADIALPTVKIPPQSAGFDNSFTRLTGLAEKLGYERVWVVESTDREAFSQATLLSLSSQRIIVGTDIVSYFSRTPTLLAMGALSLSEISGGRFILGIGPGGTEIIRDGHGIPFERPLSRAQEVIPILRRLLSGERFTYEGQFFDIRRDFRLRLSPEADIPIYVSAINPKMLQLAGELADGVMLTHLPLEAIGSVKENIAIGAARANRDPNDVHILSNQPVGVEDEGAIAALRRSMCLYLASGTFDWLVGHTEWLAVRKRIQSMWWEGRRDEAATLVEDGFLESFGLGYRDATILHRISDYLQGGVVPILYPYGLRRGQEENDVKHLLTLAANPTT